MGYELIITEKPSQAKKIAESLADSKAVKKAENGVPYYIITHNKQDIVVVSAVGHIYSLAEKEKGYTYPSYDISWVPAGKVNKGSAFTTKYLNVIKKLAKNADSFTVATDFDVEGEVIGLNVIRYACKQEDANRMKFSTLTKPDLIKSYENKQKTLEWGQAKAGETRHFLDWMYGINISRALSIAIRKAGLYKQLSSGRVQGPALRLLVDKEKVIRAFIPTPYWQLELKGKLHDVKINAMHEKNKFTDEKIAKDTFEKTKNKDATVNDIQSKQSKSQPPTPFDLTTLQMESYRSLKIAPKDTLSIAQELYSSGYISYPRTSSQQLPVELGLKKLVEELKRNPHYKKLAEKIIATTKLIPNNGKKTDPAHPAIYPTGIVPEYEQLESREIKLYDLIVRRFLATFADAATRETNKIIIDIEQENFIAKGTRTIYQGWFEFYGSHVKLEEEELPAVIIGDKVSKPKTELLSKMTLPPKRFTPASLIKELEKRNLGTKATRANIIETLFDRDYVIKKTLEPSEIGIKSSDILAKYVPKIVSEELTRHFEEEMESIRDKKMTEVQVLDEAKNTLTEILNELKSKEKEIGKELKESLFESQEKENTVGPCKKCNEGTLMIKYSPRTKQKFIGCSNYPDCKNTISLPGDGKDAKSTGKICEKCNSAMIAVGKGKSKRVVCINDKCETRQEEIDPQLRLLLEKPCPKCGSELVLRKSFYGQFVGCGNYPTCKTIINPDGSVYEKKVKAKKKTTTKKKSKKKATKKKVAKK